MFRLMNNVKTAMLLASLMVLFVIVGGYVGGQNGMIIALVFGGVMNFVAYFYSDKIALAGMGAKPVTPHQAPELHQIVSYLTNKAALPMPKIYLAPTDTPNAFATGRNPKNAAVCVTSGLMRMLDRDELTGVLAHELAHIRNYDMLISTMAATIAGAISALGYMVYFMPIARGGGNGRSLPAMLAALILAPIAAAVIRMAISRKREFNADSYGAELLGDPMPLALALEKLDRGNRTRPMKLFNESQASLFIVNPLRGGGLSSLFSTHPSTQARVRSLIGRPTTGEAR